MGAKGHSSCRWLGFARAFGVCLSQNEGQHILRALDTRLCDLLCVVALAFETGMFSIGHIVILLQF